MKKIISALLSLSLLLSCLAFHATATSNDEAAPLKVLTIGNSYSVDSMPLINTIAKAHGDEPMVLGWLFYPNCTLKQHANFGTGNKAEYDYYKNTDGTTKKTANTTLLHGLQDEKWDIIFLQQAPCEAGQPATFDTYLDKLINYVNENKTNPDAKFGWHLTWAYQKAYQDVSMAFSQDFIDLFNGDPHTMYQGIISTTQDKVLSRQIGEEGAKENEFVMMVPNGTALENARTSYFGDNLQRDTYHLNRMGQIITSYTWYAKLTGKTQLDSIALSDNDALMTLSAQDRAVILESINNAIATPLERTVSQHTTRPDEDVYFVTSAPSANGGKLHAYNQKDPTTKVEVSYSSMKNSIGKNTFYKLESGVLTSVPIANNKVAQAGYHNYFVSYNATTETLTLQNGSWNSGHGEGSSKCGFICYSSTDDDDGDGDYEVPNTTYGVSPDTPVVDVTGADHGISTLRDVVTLSSQYSIRLNHYSPVAAAPDAFYVDEIKLLNSPRYDMQEGDAFFAPGTVKSGELVEGYIIASATQPAGTKATIAVPTATPKLDTADGSTAWSRGRFWTMESGKLVKQLGVWMSSKTPGAYNFTYHDTITGYTPATADADGHLKIKHAPGHTGNKTSCGWAFNDSCGQTNAADRYRETYNDLKISVSNPPTIIDLTGNNCTNLQKVKNLTDAENAVINVYSADGTSTAGTASVIIVLDPSPNFVPNPPITYTVTADNNITGGTVSVDPTEGEYGDIVTVTTSAEKSYSLESILVDGKAITGNTFPITGNHTVSATFTFDPTIDYNTTYNITVADDVADGTVAVNKTTAYGNERVTVTATPADGYVLKAVQVNGKDISGTAFYASEDAEVSAVFAKEVKLGDVLYIPAGPGKSEYAEGYLISSDTPQRKILFYVKGGFSD